jgi:hypothetical protein
VSVEAQSLTAEDQVFVLMQAGLYLTLTRGLGAPDARICYEYAEPLCHSLNRPLLLYSALMGQWVFSLVTEKMSATMQIAKRVYSLAQEQRDSALMIGGHRALAVTLYFLGDFEAARQYAMRGVQIWRLGALQSSVEDVMSPAVHCLIFEALSDWHFGETARCHAVETTTVFSSEIQDLGVKLIHSQTTSSYYGARRNAVNPPLHCVMIFDIKANRFIGNQGYVAVDVPREAKLVDFPHTLPGMWVRHVSASSKRESPTRRVRLCSSDGYAQRKGAARSIWRNPTIF